MADQKTILLVDDEIDLQQLVKLVLKSKGYDVQTANNGREALEKLETLQPDLIILDINMPVMGGVEFYQRICDAWSQPKYPVLVLTARANMEELFRLLDVDGFMAKPFETEDLLAEVEMIIKKKTGGATPEKVHNKNEPIKVCVVENDQQAAQKIGAAFLDAGYTVTLIHSGAEAMERVCAMPPDAALIKFGLTDIPGDNVILKLKKMARTQNVKFILYTEDSEDSPEKAIIAEQMSQKEGVERFVKYQKAEDLILAVNDVLKPNR